MRKLIALLITLLCIIIGLLFYQFIVVPAKADAKKRLIEKFTDCVSDGLRERVMNHKIIKWIGSTHDQFEDMKICDECMNKLGITPTREMMEIGDQTRFKYYNH